MIVTIDGKKACVKNNILAIQKNITKSTVEIDGRTYTILKKYPSEFNKGVFNYLLED